MTRIPAVVATWAFVGLSGVVVAGPARADGSIDAKLQCQVEYGSQSEMGAACKEGVDLAAKADATAADAMNRCSASRENAARVTACQQGVTLYERFSGRVRSTDRSGFSYTWTQPKTGLQVDVGDYQASVGNQKVVDDCMRAFEGTDAPPSCMAGITMQPKAPAPVTAPARK
ncbi:MAG: hypothetical protein IT294_04490 [Deltaproteobacteria bacterium]|nr:hypothetical protein [Deltaproteobacteria bacterium]